jgi:hypothetical protein
MAAAVSAAGSGLASAQIASKATIYMWPGDKEPRPGALSGEGILLQSVRASKIGEILISYREDATCLDLKEAIAAQLQVPVGHIRLVLMGMVLEDNAVVTSANRGMESMHLLIHLAGG